MKRWIPLACWLIALTAIPVAAQAAFNPPIPHSPVIGTIQQGHVSSPVPAVELSFSAILAGDESTCCRAGVVRKAITIQLDMLRAMLSPSTAPRSQPLPNDGGKLRILVAELTAAIIKTKSNDPTSSAKPPPASAKTNRA